MRRHIVYPARPVRPLGGYRACDICGAETGNPCVNRWTTETRKVPHIARKLRAGLNDNDRGELAAEKIAAQGGDDDGDDN